MTSHVLERMKVTATLEAEIYNIRQLDNAETNVILFFVF